MSNGKKTPGASIPTYHAEVVPPGARSLHPELAPEHTLSGVQQISGGLLGMIEHTIAIQMAAGDLTMAKQYFDKRAEMMEHMLQSAFRRLKPSDFVSFSSISGDKEDDGQPWLIASAAERVGAICGVSYKFVGHGYHDVQSEDSEGPWFIRRAHMSFSWGTQSCEAIGEASSKDKFLSHKGALNAAQVPRTKLGTKAQSRAKQVGICTVLGLRSMTWARIRELTGNDTIGPKTVKKATFEKGGQGGGGKQKAKEGYAPKAQVRRVYEAWCSAGRVNPDSWDANKGHFWDFVARVIDADPSKPKKWDSYRTEEITALLAAVEEIPG